MDDSLSRSAGIPNAEWSDPAIRVDCGLGPESATPNYHIERHRNSHARRCWRNTENDDQPGEQLRLESLKMRIESVRIPFDTHDHRESGIDLTGLAGA